MKGKIIGHFNITMRENSYDVDAETTDQQLGQVFADMVVNEDGFKDVMNEAIEIVLESSTFNKNKQQ